MEANRKYVFGVMLMHGEPTQHKLTGFWVIRGDEIPASMLDVPDVELYEWTKISWEEAEASKAKIGLYLAEEDVDGQTCLDSKIFK
eukprot:NODE_5596_length_374_cov_1352.338462_g4501_i0.p1 GENE.NODE_5596_length_374_cov_1352.338462_g4501_i0~~NODE_5596_length_374_cov_1352.338462_g4501_i0.p1  ORF type:complete len:86 (+),score=21.62 NODE_5596_length_374_cov_1352.338462_g4501_i0:38-295(+)